MKISKSGFGKISEQNKDLIKKILQKRLLIRFFINNKLVVSLLTFFENYKNR